MRMRVKKMQRREKKRGRNRERDLRVGDREGEDATVLL
jgi:hypothetical protein